MSTVPRSLPLTSSAEPVWPERRDNGYPTADGRPMAETDLHRDVMVDMIEILKQYFAGQTVYVSGNLLLFYEPGNKRKHISPDVLVTKGIEMRQRDNYLVWEEGSPHVVMEMTSRTTRKEDAELKIPLYRDVLKVQEYFLFDPYGEYLKPALQGYRLQGSQYLAIVPNAAGRLESEQLGLHLEQVDKRLRLFNPATGKWLLTAVEQLEQERARLDEAERENARLRAELEALRKQQAP
jgi:Uma2 family endonuclease